jgi:hypothetical protein
VAASEVRCNRRRGSARFCRSTAAGTEDPFASPVPAVFPDRAADPDFGARPFSDRRPLAGWADASAGSDLVSFALPPNPLRWRAWKRQWRVPPAIGHLSVANYKSALNSGAF